MGEDLERDQDEAGTAKSAFVSATAELGRLASEPYGVRERYEG